jgi:hypothetical protein
MSHKPSEDSVRWRGVGHSRRLSGWRDGLVEWVDGDTAYLSVAFTWRLNEARDRAIWYRSMGLNVRAGGPATFRPHGYLADVAQLGGDVPDAIRRHNDRATIASRGCPVNCWFCIVPALEGVRFTLLPDFAVRPVLCDNNLSALPVEYQRYIIEKYQKHNIPLLDANSGFEPRTFDGGVLERWTTINRGPWRFGYDDIAERSDVYRMMMLLRSRGMGPRRIQVYCMIGHEPVSECLQRIHEIIEWGGEPYVQRNIKLNALEKSPWIRHDWTLQKLAHVARYANRRIWRYARFEDYDANSKSSRRRSPTSQLRLISDRA